MNSITKVVNIIILSSVIHLPVVALERSVILSVPTMNCMVCPITVKRSLINVEGVVSASASLDEKTANVTFDDEVTDVDALLFATEMAGYPSSLIEE